MLNKYSQILISSPSFKIGTNLKISLNGKKNEPDVKPKVKTKPNIKPNKEHKQDVKPNIKVKQDVKMVKTEPDPYEEERLLWYWE